MKKEITVLLLLSGLVLGLLVSPHVWMKSAAAGPSSAARDLDIADLGRSGTDEGIALSKSLQQQCPDQYEPNDSFENAWSLKPGVIQSYICKQDLDYFKFSANAGDLIRLDLYDLPANYDLCLYDPNQEQMACSANDGTRGETIEEEASSQGDYYALIYGVTGDLANPYTFRLQVLSSTCPDPYEPNETFASAWPVSAGQYSAYICKSGDQDWFGIYLLPSQELEVILTDLPKNYDLELYDPFGLLVAGSHNKGTIMEKISFLSSKTGGAYRVRVLGVAGDSDPSRPYILMLNPGTLFPTPTPTPTPTATPIPACNPDPYEPNDSPDTAALIKPGTQISAYLCPEKDYDWYRFHVSGGVKTDVRLSGGVKAGAGLSDLPAAYELTLYDATEEAVARGSGTGTAPRELTHYITAEGDYLVRISPSSLAWAEGPYEVGVDLDPLPPMTLRAVADTYVMQSDPTSTHGDERVVRVWRDEFDYEDRGLFRFDLSDVPATTIASAFFRLSLREYSTSGMHLVDLLRVSESWDEETVNWNNQPLAVSTGISAPVGSVEDNYYEWEVTDLVQSWLTGGVDNYGLELCPATAGDWWRSFRSSEYTGGTLEVIMWCVLDPACHSRAPELIINFTEPGPGSLGSISGRVYHDADEDGRYDPGESGVGLVRVELFRDLVSQGHRDTADDGGTYTFDDLPAGDYDVVVLESALPGEYELRGTGERSVSLAAGEDRSGVDFAAALRPWAEPTPPPTLNLTAEGIEFIQVLHDQVLIAGKPTLARVYVGVTGTTDPVVSDISGRLYHGFDWIDPIATADLLPRTDPMNDPDVVGNLVHTLNFLLPDGWTTAGEHDFTAWVNYYVPGLECPGCWDDDNQYSTWAHYNSPVFRDAEPLEVTMVEVTADGISPTATRADTVRWLRQTYPINTVNFYSDTLSVTGYDFTDHSGGCGTGWGDLLIELDGFEVFGTLGDSSTMHFYGLLDNSVPHSWVDGSGNTHWINGCGYTPGQAAAGIVGRGWITDGRIMAHEIGHNLGRQHTCCSGEPRCVDQHPGSGGTIFEYGVDLSNPSEPDYLDPNDYHDIMTYCSDRWPSDVTYDALWSAFRPGAASQQAVREASYAQQEYLVGFGHIVDGLVTMTRPFYRLMLPAGTSDEPGQGPYALELQDASGTPLFTRYFDTVGDSIDPIEGRGYFRQIVPWQAGTAQVVIKEGQTVLLITHVSANSPEVTLLSPNGGEFWPPYGEHTISWTGSDADGDPLRYALQYSPDGGNTWKAVATNLVGESYALGAGRLAGSETALLRVVASDGVNTSQDESDGTFTVEGKPPGVYILYPLDGSIIQPGRPVVLEGAGTDLEDGHLADDTLFTWSSSLEGELGTGRKLYFDDLLPGRHTITLEVADGDGFVGEDSISISIGGTTTYLPLILKQD